MASKLILIRGNSGSGKSTVAKKLRYKLGEKTMLIPQDLIKREIVRVKETEKTPYSVLIKQIALFGKSVGCNVIVEGIFVTKGHSEMLKELIKDFDKSYVYYFDVPFEETVRRHKSRPKANSFDEIEMRKWWHEKDYLGVKKEIIINELLGEDEIVDLIYEHVTSD
ncbi:MAG TPA: AAA family ATPase [Candidatus Saccharimonadales bacterium]|nr:AAA family ATPase [Candidatus Saccharimonadales bacterium]